MKTYLASADDRFDFLEWNRVCQCGALTLRSRTSTTHDCHLWLLCELSERVVRRSVACWGGDSVRERGRDSLHTKASSSVAP